MNAAAQLKEDAQAVDETGEEAETEQNSPNKARSGALNAVDGSEGNGDQDNKGTSNNAEETPEGPDAVDENEATRAEQAQEDTELPPTEATKSALDEMVREKEKVDAEEKSPSDANKRARSWVDTKSARQETDARKALGVDRHPLDDVR